MATSGITLLTTSGSELSLLAYQILGQYGADRTQLSAFNEAVALRMLNFFMKQTQVYNGFLWKQSAAYLFVNGTNLSYTLSDDDDVGYHATENYTSTTITSAVTTGDVIITVTSTAGMSDLDFVLIPLADLSYFSATIAVLSATTFTMSDPITEDIVVGVRTFSYTTKIDKPIRMYGACLRRYTGEATYTELKTQPETFEDYTNDFSEKTYANNNITRWSYIPLVNTGQFYVFGTPTQLGDVIVFTYQKQTENLTSGAQEPDFPCEWFLCLAFKLAYYLSFSLKISPEDRAALKAECDQIFMETISGDIQTAPLRKQRREME